MTEGLAGHNTQREDLFLLWMDVLGIWEGH